MKKHILTFCFVLLFLITVSGAALAADSPVVPPVVAVPNVHTVISEKLLYLVDGDTGIWYKPFRGCATMSWKDKTRYGFFNAKACVETSETETGAVAVRRCYEFRLVAISNCNSDYIEGLWDITVNGTLACSGCVGKAYGINGNVGDYFKLYIGDSRCYDEKWHLSGYITARKDF